MSHSTPKGHKHEYAQYLTSKHSAAAPSILIFDSGVGGLSILTEVHKHFPSCSITYASDNRAFPYGTKTQSELIERVDLVLHQLQLASHPDIIIVACNTASTVALPRIRARFDLPIVGVVPAIKPAAQISQSKIIGLLGTPGTVARDYTRQLINEFAHDCHVVAVGSSELVKLAEDKLRGKAVDQRSIRDIVQAFANNSAMDTVILACTHFPLLKQELQQALPNIGHWVDTAEAIARRVGCLFAEMGYQASNTVAPIPTPHEFILTEDAKDIQQLKPYLEQMGFGQVKVVAIN